MADNVILPGTGAGVATDEVAANVHVQKMKLLASTTDSTEALSKQEDATHSSGDSGLMALGVRKDAPAALAAADGRYVPPMYDARGRLYVSTPDTQQLVRRYDIGTTTIYVGTAPRGTATSAAAWTIKKTTLDVITGNPTLEQWTNEGAAVWDNRTSETYT